MQLVYLTTGLEDNDVQYIESLVTVLSQLCVSALQNIVLVTCTCRRVMERIINTQLIDYLFSNNLIAKHQHGFLLNHSTCTNLLETIND